MDNAPQMTYLRTLTLTHQGDCVLLGVTPDLTVYVDEMYGADQGGMAQHAIRLDGTWIASADDDWGKNPQLVTQMAVPTNMICPCREPQTRELNFSGARQRGLQEWERIREVVMPLAMADKMMVLQKLGMTMPPPMLLGLASSTVLSESDLGSGDMFILCRRLAFAYTLPKPQRDDEGQPYDYDTALAFVAHVYDRRTHEPPALDAAFTPLDGTALHRPMDCVLVNRHLFVADSGGSDRVNQVHIWAVDA